MKKYLLLLLILFAQTAVLGNGGPSEVGFDKTGGNIYFIMNNDISCEKEDLHIILKDKYAEVEVKYILKNHGNKQKVKYAFPVRQYGIRDSTGKDYDSLDVAGVSPSLQFAKKNFENIKKFINNHFSYEIYSDNGKIDYKIEKLIKENLNHNESEDAKKKSYSLYVIFASEIVFEKNKTKEIVVRYRQPYYHLFWEHAWASEPYPYDERMLNEEVRKTFIFFIANQFFHYNLATGGNWKDGVIKECNIFIDNSKIGKIVPFKIFPSGYYKVEKGFYRKYVNLKPKKEDNILIVTDVAMKMQNDFIKKEIISIKSSSTLLPEKRYSARNLIDGDPINTVWVEGSPGNGVGEWVEIEFKNPLPIDKIGIIPGYFKSKEIYYGNNRVARLRLDYTSCNPGKPCSEDYMLIDIEDKEFDDSLPNALYTMISYHNLKEGFYYNNFIKIRLTIEEVYKGNKWNDTCIGELIFFRFARNKEKYFTTYGKNYLP